MDSTFIPDIFLIHPNAKGEVQKPDALRDSTAVISYSFNISAISTLNRGAGQMGGRGTMSPITLDLVHDKGYAKLRKAGGTGVTTDNVTIKRFADGKLMEDIVLTKAKVVAAGSSHSHGAQDQATVTFAFSEAKVTTYQQNGDQTVVADDTTYNMADGSTQ